MGGRGGASGGLGTLSADYKNAYNIEIENAKDFPAAFALEDSANKSAVGYQMYVHKDVTGRSLIADTENEISFLKKELRDAPSMGTSYGMTKDAIKGMQAGLKEKIMLREKSVEIMKSSRTEYEIYSNQARIGNEKSKRRNGKWM